MDGLKLFVVGETSGNPGDWSHFQRAYVIAHNKAEAIAIAGIGDNEPAVEVAADEPQLLFIEEDIGSED